MVFVEREVFWKSWIYKSSLSLLHFLTFLFLFTTQVTASNVSDSDSGSSQFGIIREQLAPRKVKVCENSAKEVVGQGGLIELPTLSLYTFQYSLEKYEVDLQAGTSICPNGEPPPAITGSLVYAKDDFEQRGFSNYEAVVYPDGVSRSGTLLLTNGYLSVGINGSVTYYSPDEYCIDSLKGNGSSAVATYRVCSPTMERPALPKCCPYGMAFDASDISCKGSPQAEAWEPTYLNVTFLERVPSVKVNPVYTSSQLECGAHMWISGCNNVFHPVSDGRIAYIGGDRSWKLFPTNTPFCLDLIWNNGSSASSQEMITYICAEKEEMKSASVSALYIVLTYLAAFFHSLTTLVHLITWPKQNIHGRVLCSCTGSLIFQQLCLGNANLFGLYESLASKFVCVGNGILGQFFAIAAFSWLLIVNIDLWRTFKLVRSDGSNQMKKFLMYSAAGWGFPLLVSAVSISLEYTFKCRSSNVLVPDYGVHYCYVAPWAQGPYLFWILAVLIAGTCGFAMLTLYGVYKLKQGTGNLRSSKAGAERENLYLVLKLSVVMGLSWIFEVISWQATDQKNENHVGWIILDAYNSLSAVLIFVIFVCKKSTLNLLRQSSPRLAGLAGRVLQFKLSTASSASTAVTSNGSCAAATNAASEKSTDQGIQREQRSSNKGPVQLTDKNEIPLESRKNKSSDPPDGASSS